MNIKKIVASSAASAIIRGSLVAPAFAAAPKNQACLGKDVSGFTQFSTGFVGNLFQSIAKNGTPGAGTEIQAHLAGNVPDTVIPNTCNDL